MVEDLRRLVLYRREQDNSLNREPNRLHADLAQISPGYQTKAKTRLTVPSALGRVTRLISADRSVRADIARRRVRTLRGLIKQIKELNRRIGQLVAVSGTTLTEIYGIGTLGAAEIIAQVGDLLAITEIPRSRSSKFPTPGCVAESSWRLLSVGVFVPVLGRRVAGSCLLRW